MVHGGDVDDADKLADKLTKQVIENQKKKSILNMDIIMEEKRKESNVGKKLTDFTLRKVILIVLVMLFTNPLFMIQSYITDPSSLNFGLDILKKTKLTEDDDLRQQFFSQYVQMYKEIENTPLLFICAKIKGKETFKWSN